jgi:hypothetical protein
MQYAADAGSGHCIVEADPSEQQPRDNAQKSAGRDLHKQVALNLTIDLIKYLS